MAPGCSLPSLPAGPTTTQHGHTDPHSRSLVPASATINSLRQMATFPPSPDTHGPYLPLAFCQHSASLLIISLIQRILHKCGTASAISWWQVLKFLSSFWIDAVFFFCFILSCCGKRCDKSRKNHVSLFFYFVSTFSF